MVSCNQCLLAYSRVGYRKPPLKKFTNGPHIFCSKRKFNNPKRVFGKSYSGFIIKNTINFEIFYNVMKKNEHVY